MKYSRVVLFVAFAAQSIALVAGRAGAQAPLRIVCIQPKCEYPVASHSQNPTAAFVVLGDGKVEISADPSSAPVEPNDFLVAESNPVARITYRGKVGNPGSRIPIIVIAKDDTGKSESDTIYFVSMEPPGLAPLSISPFDGERRYRWFTGHLVPTPVAVEVRNLPSDDVLHRVATCESRRVAFRHLSDPKSAPDTVPAEWDRRRERCIASTRWKLTDAPGRQELEANLVDGHSTFVGRPHVYFSATAIPPAHLIVGLALLSSVDPVLAPENSESERKFTPRLQPMFGVDIPVLFGSREGGMSDILNRVRFVIATSFTDHIGVDLYTGVDLVPLVFGAQTQGFPLQLTGGRRWGFGKAKSNNFLSLNIDASSVVNSLLTGLGLLK